MTTAIRPYEVRDRDSLVALWDSCDLTRAWNDPGRDIDRKLANDAQNLLINYLAVHASHQRQGFARQLMAEAERRLREVGCAKVNLQVRSSNARARDFFSQIGFDPDAVVSLGKRLESDE
jgi:ribosomal protein S18 acetylase RimI-like enzyme